MNTRHRHGARFGLIPAIVLLMTGCVPASNITPVDNLAQLETDQVLVVGKVELIPALAPDEQELGSNFEEYRDLALVITDGELRRATKLTYRDFTQRINAALGETFFVSHPAKPFYILKSWIVMRARIELVASDASPANGNAPLSGAFNIDVKPDDRAIYIGTLRYHRDDFFATEKVEVMDEFAQAKAEFYRQFGDQVPLRKALARRVTGP